MSVQLVEKTPSAYSYPLLIKNLLTTPRIYSPHQEIIYRNRMRYTYITFINRVNKLANLLKSLGIKEGDTVAVMDWDSHRYLECFFAVPMIGAVLHTINIRLSPEQLIYTINHAKDDLILVNTDFVKLLESVADKFETVDKLILLADTSDIPETGLSFEGEYESLLDPCSDSYDFPDFDENAKATTFYTTGTTGLPKGVYFSHRQLVLHTYGLMSCLTPFYTQARVHSGDVYMPLTPMFHVHAWGMPYLFTMLGARQVYPGRYEPETILQLIADEKVTFSHCVPTILHMLLSIPSSSDYDLSGWKVVIGGSAMPRGLCKQALKRGINAFSAYGMSETCPVLTMANLKPEMLDWDPEDQTEIRCRTGLPIPNVLLEIVDPDNNPVPHDGKSTGEVVVRAPWLTQGYLNDPERSEQLWKNGWLHTGDIGFIDSEGYLQITDRLKDVIKTGGEWISSLELEDIISRHEAVSEVAVIGVPDEKWGERPMALVVIREEFRDKTAEEDIKQFFLTFVEKGIIPRYGVPENIVFIDVLPKTSVGKLNKKQMRKQFG